MVYYTCRLYQSLGYKSILKSCDFHSHPVVRMATYKTRLQSEKEFQRMLQESGSEGDDSLSSVSDKSSKSESEIEEDPVENSESSDSDTTTPPPQKITKEESWKWIVTGVDHQNCILQEILG